VTVPSTQGPGTYTINVRHRNHLAIGSASSVNLVAGNNPILDMTTNTLVRGGNQNLLTGTNGKYGLKQGNVVAPYTRIDISDRAILLAGTDLANTYSNFDVNLDGIITSVDRSIAYKLVDSVAQ
jgi:hypothetical protein